MDKLSLESLDNSEEAGSAGRRKEMAQPQQPGVDVMLAQEDVLEKLPVSLGNPSSNVQSNLVTQLY